MSTGHFDNAVSSINDSLRTEDEDYWDVVGQAIQVRHSKTNQNAVLSLLCFQYFFAGN